MKKVSVVVPIYNAEAYLERALKEIIQQTYIDIEIILVNDGSTDKSLEICKKYMKKDNRIKIVTGENHGAAYARNQGIKNATGDYLLFIDADDIIDNNYIKILMSTLKEDKYDLILCGHREIYKKSNKQRTFLISCEEYEQLLGNIQDDYNILEMYLIAPWGKLYDLNIIKRNKIFFPDGFRNAEDHIFNQSYLKHVKKYRFVRKVMYYYIHQNENSIMSNQNEETFKYDLKCLLLRKNFLDELNIKNKEKIIIAHILDLIYKYTFMNSVGKNKYVIYRECLNKITKFIPTDYKIKKKKERIIIYFLKNNNYKYIFYYNHIKYYYNKFKNLFVKESF